MLTFSLLFHPLFHLSLSLSLLSLSPLSLSLLSLSLSLSLSLLSLSLSLSLRHTKQFVGLEPTQSQKDHWDAVQCSIVVQKLQETVRASSSKQSISNYPSRSLVEAILPHESSESVILSFPY